MQTQAHVSGQAVGDTGGQISVLTPQNGSSLSLHIGGSWKTWKGGSDLTNVRKCMLDKIIELLKRRKSSPGLDKQLYNVARRLEEGLFKEATSKEEYMDLRTLEMRLQAFARRSQHGNHNQSFVHHSVSSNGTVGTMIPTPGMSNTRFGYSVVASSSGDIPTMTDPSNGNSFIARDGNSNQKNVLVNSGDNLSSVPGPLGNIPQRQQGVGGMPMGAENNMVPTIGFRNQMIPTSGLGKSSSGGMGYSSVNYIGTTPQQIIGGANGHFAHNMSGQMGGNNMQEKNSSYALVNGSLNGGVHVAENNPKLMNSTTALSNSGGYLNASQYGNVQLHASSDRRTTQQHQQGLLQSTMTNPVAPLSCDVYAINPADLAGSGNLHAPALSNVLPVPSSLNGKSLGFQSTRMIPVPGLPSQQQTLPALQRCQQNQSQNMSTPHGISFLPKGQSIQRKQPKLRYEQHQQQLHTYQQTHMDQQIQHCQQQQLLVESNSILHNQPELIVSVQKWAGIETHQNGASEKELEEKDTFSLPTSQQQQLNTLQASTSHDQQGAGSYNVYNGVAPQGKPGVWLQGEKMLQMQENHHIPEQYSNIIKQQQPSKEESPQLIFSDMARVQQPSQEVSGNAIISTATSQPRPGTVGSASGRMQPSVSYEQQRTQYYKQQMWLLFLRHVSRCRVQECRTVNCTMGQELWAHITRCCDIACSFPRCHGSRKLLFHHQQCQNHSCPVCGPVRHYIMKQRANSSAKSSNLGAIDCVRPKYSNLNNTVGTKISLPTSCAASTHDSAQKEQRPSKRRKSEPSSPSNTQQEAESVMVYVTSPTEVQADTQMQTQDFEASGHDAGMMKSHILKSSKVESLPVKRDQAASPQQEPSQKWWEFKNDICQNPPSQQGQMQGQQVKVEPVVPSSESVPVQVMQEAVQVNQESLVDIQITNGTSSEKFGKPKIKGVSLTELFTPEQIREHVKGQGQWGWKHANGSDKSSNLGAIDCVRPKSSNFNSTVGTKISLPASCAASTHDSAQEEQRPSKRRKSEPSSPSDSQQEAESVMVSVTSPSEVQAVTQMQNQDFEASGHDAGMMKTHIFKSSKVELVPVKRDRAASPQQGPSQKWWEFKNDICQNPPSQQEQMQGQQVKVEPAVPSSESVPVQVKQETVQVNQETLVDIPITNSTSFEKFGKPKIKGVSLTELFTPEQIREHVKGLQQWGWKRKAKTEKHRKTELQMTGETCQLCNLDTITFDPPPIYCSSCGDRIRRNAFYYIFGIGDTRHCFCSKCYSETPGDSVKMDRNAYAKAKLEKKKNMDEIDESWVCCDICEKWQHQVCALFNGKRNENEQAEYTCPNCYMEEIKRGVRKPLPQSTVLGAKDLPKTFLSDHIEQRLFRRLKEERQERAEALGRNFEEVPGAEALVVRVVSSIDKVLEVKQRFVEMFQHQNYASEFPYKSKVLLLFQKIEGVEVCLFGMYVQEFGSECSDPNQRRIYLSYLDSVKYFRPDVKTVNGEALRTFVYHEILIGYLGYCKRRGFTSCYIWACPPLKGEDYILYCHPETQKTPKSDKLREWYLTMLRKASKEDIVVDVTNMYDYFFLSAGERKAKVTAARLPYFDGDYWPGTAEEMIMQIQGEEAGLRYQKNKKYMTKRSLKAAVQTDVSINTLKDALLMKKLGDSIHPMKEDFIMVHLQPACAHCCLFIVSGKRWVCKKCTNFQLCEKCYEAEKKLDERESHPVNTREKHLFFPIEVTNVPADTKDKDEIMESEFFDTRQAFLSLCQGNHYQYDTLRHAKHSSMMVLYHLHNPTAPAFVSTCNICQNDIEIGQGWRCEICPDYDLCNVCYKKDGSVKHPHRLTAHPSLADRDAQNKEARQKRVLQLRKMLDLLIHASRCHSSQCEYQNCRKVKGLFRHGTNCKKRAVQGCSLCKGMWYMLQLHARACKDSECCVPRCKDLKQHIRRSQNQMESRRRADVMEMMRNRATEIAQDSHSSHIH